VNQNTRKPKNPTIPELQPVSYASFLRNVKGMNMIVKTKSARRKLLNRDRPAVSLYKSLLVFGRISEWYVFDFIDYQVLFFVPKSY
jgi:hypothetical protein